MANPGHGPRLDKLEENLKKLTDLVNDLSRQLSNLQTEVKLALPGLSEAHKSVAEVRESILVIKEQIGGLQHLKQQPEAVSEVKTKIELIGRDIGLLQDWQKEADEDAKEWGRRKWLIVPPVIAAILTAILTVIIQKYILH
jgi:chromosome segregation ATPase